jgi:hypothetical protein
MGAAKELSGVAQQGDIGTAGTKLEENAPRLRRFGPPGLAGFSLTTDRRRGYNGLVTA